jgi:hypothetical protein
VNGTPLMLWEARCAFTRALALLIEWASDEMPQYEIALGEGLVAITDAADGDYDGPHLKGGAHYTGLGIDLLVYDSHSGQYISDGTHPVYRTLGDKWKRIHWLARWGGDFSTPDPDHYSFEWGGKA